jgi:hypothetical protein
MSESRMSRLFNPVILISRSVSCRRLSGSKSNKAPCVRMERCTVISGHADLKIFGSVAISVLSVSERQHSGSEKVTAHPGPNAPCTCKYCGSPDRHQYRDVLRFR